MGRFVLDTEAAFVRMLANRVLRLEREAAARGETFQPAGGPTRLASGYGVRLRHDVAPHGYVTVVEVWPKPDGTLVITEAAELASEILAHPARLQMDKRDHLQFVADA